MILTLSGLNLLCHLHTLQAANCCRNSRLAAEKDDLKWVANEKNTLLLLKHLHKKFRSKSSGCWRFNYSSGMQHDA